MVSVAIAQPFGRFGYQAAPTAPRFVFESKGFRSQHPSADLLKFEIPVNAFKASLTTDIVQTWQCNAREWCPSKIRTNLLSPGFELFCHQGLRLKLSCSSSPYLSWFEGSVRAGIPTPAVSWCVLSFRDAQPPLIFGFLGGKGSMVIKGSAGDFSVETNSNYVGWIRVGLPEGLNPDAANTAAALGKLSQKAKDGEEVWTRTSPALLKSEIEDTDTGVDVTYTFDSSQVLMPEPLTLAEGGGYLLKIRSPHHPAPWQDDESPQELTDGNELKVHFPMERPLIGRAIGIGSSGQEPLSSVSYLDLSGVVALGCENLLATRDAQTATLCETTMTEYLNQVPYHREPLTAQLLPFSSNGNGLDLCASQAFLMQCISTAKGNQDQNSLLTSLSTRLDWATWRYVGVLDKISDRALALGSAAAAMSTDKTHRLNGARMMAGLSAQYGLVHWRAKHGKTDTERTVYEPLKGLRNSLFRVEGYEKTSSDFDRLLLSPVRILSSESLTLKQEDPFVIASWPTIDARSSVMNLIASKDLSVTIQHNLRKATFEVNDSSFDISYAAAESGTCAVFWNWPKLKLPKVVPVPAYSDNPTIAHS